MRSVEDFLRYRKLSPRTKHFVQRFTIPTLIAALAVVPVIVWLDLSTGVSHEIAHGFNWLIWAYFAMELVVIFVIEPNKREIVRLFPMLFVIVVLSFPLLPTSIQSIRVLQILPIFAALRITTRIMPRLVSLQGLQFAGILVAVAVLGGGTVFGLVEHIGTWNGVWFAIQTATTVGYGDIVPHTTGGRIIAIAIMGVGLGFGSLLVGVLAERFLTSAQLPQVNRINKRAWRAEHEAEQALAEEATVLAKLNEISARLSKLETK